MNIASHFNWGYHDGAHDSLKEAPNRWADEAHFSNRYRMGYLYGYRDASAGRYTRDSSDAKTEAVNFGDIK